MADDLKKNAPTAAVELEEISQCKRRVKFTVPYDEVEKEFNAIYEDVKATTQIQGFRPGKAPRQVVEMRMGKEFRETALSRIRQRALVRAVEDHKLKLIGSPQFENIIYEKGKPFTFDATVEVIPDIALPEYKGIKIERRDPAPTTEADVDAELDRLRENHAFLNDVKDRPLRDGDFAVITYEEEADGQTEKFEKRFVEVTKESLLPGFGEKIVGMKLGEKIEFQIRVPDDYGDKEAAGKEINYRLEINEIKTKSVPEADDSFAKKIGFKSLENLRKRIHTTLTERKERESEQNEIGQIMRYLLEKTDFEVPRSLLAEETKRGMNWRIEAALRAGTPVEQIREEREELLKDEVSRAYTGLKANLIIFEIAHKEGIEVSAAEVDAQLKRTAPGKKSDENTQEKEKDDSDIRDDIEHDLLRQKVISFLHNSAIKE